MYAVTVFNDDASRWERIESVTLRGTLKEAWDLAIEIAVARSMINTEDEKGERLNLARMVERSNLITDGTVGISVTPITEGL